MTSTIVPAPPEVAMSRDRLRALLRRTLRESGYLLASWPILMAAFVVVITLFSMGIGMVIIWIGVPLLIATVGAARAFAVAVRGLQRHLLGQDPAPGSYRRRGPDESFVRHALGLFTHPQSWIDVGFSLFAWCVAVITWSLTIAWWSAAVGGITAPIWALFTDQRIRFWGIPTDFGPGDWLLEILAHLCIGLVALVTLPREELGRDGLVAELGQTTTDILDVLMDTENLLDHEDHRPVPQVGPVGDAAQVHDRRQPEATASIRARRGGWVGLSFSLHTVSTPFCASLRVAPRR